MQVHRLVAVAVVLAHVIASVPGGLLFLCTMDGQARTECCCAVEKPPSDHQVVSSTSCCDVSASESISSPSITDTRVIDVSVPNIAAASIVPPRPSQISAFVAELDAAPPRGPPIYLKLRSLLI